MCSLLRSPKLHTPPRFRLSANAFDTMMDGGSGECPHCGNDEPFIDYMRICVFNTTFTTFLCISFKNSVSAFALEVSTIVVYIPHALSSVRPQSYQFTHFIFVLPASALLRSSANSGLPRSQTSISSFSSSCMNVFPEHSTTSQKHCRTVHFTPSSSAITSPMYKASKETPPTRWPGAVLLQVRLDDALAFSPCMGSVARQAEALEEEYSDDDGEGIFLLLVKLSE
jgi:hypothetical protein